MLGLRECVYKQGGKDPEKVVMTNAASGQLGIVTDATQVSPDKLAGHPIDQGMMSVYHNGVSTWKTGMRLAACPRMKQGVQ